MTYESDQDGVLQIVAGEGDTLAVGEVIARVGAAPRAARDERPASAGPASGAARPARRRAASGRRGRGAGGRGARARRRRPRRAAPAAGERVKASPLARRIARESGVDLRALTGSGPGGRIVKADVLAPPPARRRPRPPDAAAHAPRRHAAAGAAGVRGGARGRGDGQGRDDDGRAVAHAADDRAADGRVEGDDPRLHAADRGRHGGVRGAARGAEAALAGAAAGAPTYNDMVVKACALALREHPRANGSYRDGRLQLHSRVNVGVAVAARGRAGRADGVRRRREVARRDRARDARAGRARARGHDHPAGARRRHVHGVQPGDVRRAQLHRDHQPAAGGDPVGRLAGAARGGARGRGGRRATR